MKLITVEPLIQKSIHILSWLRSVSVVDTP